MRSLRCCFIKSKTKKNKQNSKKKKQTPSKKTKLKATSIATLEEANELPSTNKAKEAKPLDCDENEKAKIKKTKKKTKKKPPGTSQLERETTKQKPMKTSSEIEACIGKEEAEEMPYPQRRRKGRSSRSRGKDDVSVDPKNNCYVKSNAMRYVVKYF